MKMGFVILALLLSGCGLARDFGDCMSSNNLAQARCRESIAYDAYDDCLKLHDRYVCEATRQNIDKASEQRQLIQKGLL